MPKDKDRPPHILAAIERGDTDYLSKCGRNGARRTNQIKRAKKLAEARAERAREKALLEARKAEAQAAEEAQRQAQEIQKRARERVALEWWRYHVIPSNGHIIDPDGVDLDYCTVVDSIPAEP